MPLNDSTQKFILTFDHLSTALSSALPAQDLISVVFCQKNHTLDICQLLYTKLVASSAYFPLCQVWISFIVKRFPASSCCSILQSLEQAGIFSQQGGAGGSDQRPTFFQGRNIDITQIALFAKINIQTHFCVW